MSTSKPEFSVADASSKKPVRIVIPDSGPLISLAMAGSLDLLLMFRPNVRIVVTDVVEFEVTHKASEHQDALEIKDFLARHQNSIEVLPTTIGSLALEPIRKSQETGVPASLPKDLGELSITNFIISLRTFNPGEPTLVIIEDDWFVANSYAVPGNVHLLSTSAWLDGLEQMGVIESASALRAQIMQGRPNFRGDFMVDEEAKKVEGGTSWRAAIRG